MTRAQSAVIPLIEFDPGRRHHPLTPATVTINGSDYGQRSTIWSGLKVHEAEFRTRSLWPGEDRHLRVPWCHINETWDWGGCFYRLRPKMDGWEFVRAPNGEWVLQEIANAD